MAAAGRSAPPPQEMRGESVVGGPRHQPQPVFFDERTQPIRCIDRRPVELSDTREDPVHDPLVLLLLEAAGGEERKAARTEKRRRRGETLLLCARQPLD